MKEIKRINDKEFVEILRKAVIGDLYSINVIIDEYEKLILKHSKIKGVVDEDCVSEIKLKIIKNISKFKGL